MASNDAINEMKTHLKTHGLVLGEALGGLPLVTFEGEDRALAALVLGLSQGIEARRWAGQVLDLGDERDLERLAAGDWQDGWNGGWVHVAAGHPGKAGSMDARSLFDACGGAVFGTEGFAAAILASSQAAARTAEGTGNEGPSLIEALAGIAREKQGKAVALYGARGQVWVPLSGPCAGLPVISPVTWFDYRVADLLHAKGMGPDTPESEVEKAIAEVAPAARKDCLESFFDSEQQAAADFYAALEGSLAALERLAGHLSGNFRDHSAFDAAKAEPLKRLAAGEDDGPLTARADCRWYGVNRA